MFIRRGAFVPWGEDMSLSLDIQRVRDYRVYRNTLLSQDFPELLFPEVSELL